MTHSLTLIGAAFPRTGTMSVKKALEALGVGRCYHMHEVFLNRQHISIWDATCAGTLPNWRSLLAGYAATLDVPACLYWRELDPALQMIRRLFFEACMQGRFEDRAFAVGVYRRYCEEVRQAVPSNRLLEYEVAEGWGPPCRFLEYALPAMPFSKTYTREQFQTRAKIGS